MTDLIPEFLWGAATAAHQVEGNNVNSDWWRRERLLPGVLQPSGDANDSYHRYPEDMRLLADAGLNAYRFSLEWSRIEPVEGGFSAAALAHYRRMIDLAISLGLTPVVTLHHFTVPLWFADLGGWHGPRAIELFERYTRTVAGILHDVPWVCTINEPNVLVEMHKLDQLIDLPADFDIAAALDAPGPRPLPDVGFGRILIAAHHAARAALRETVDARVGWTVAMQALEPTPGNEEKFFEARHAWEDVYLEGSHGDDFIGVQSYTSQTVDEHGVVSHPPHPDNTLTGWAYRPDALGIALRRAWEAGGGIPLVVTENGIATSDDERRIRYTTEALRHLTAAVADGIDVRGYIHWSALDNYEWGQWQPTFGLIAVDRVTFARAPKPSLYWLGRVSRSNGASL